MLTLFLLSFGLESSPFLKGSFDAALTKAKDEKKLVFVDIYTTWCGPCKLMDRTTFKDKEVRNLLSESVVAFKIDAEKGEGINIARKYKVTGYPCFLILDSEGKLVSKYLGFIPAKPFINWVKENLE